MVGRGIPEDSKEFWGYSVPTMKGIRAELETLSFVMKPIDGGKSTSFTILAETNPKIHVRSPATLVCERVNVLRCRYLRRFLDGYASNMPSIFSTA